MAQKFLSNIELEAGLVDVNGNTGTAGQILSSTGTGVDWISQSEISSDSAEVIDLLFIAIFIPPFATKRKRGPAY